MQKIKELIHHDSSSSDSKHDDKHHDSSKHHDDKHHDDKHHDSTHHDSTKHSHDAKKGETVTVTHPSQGVEHKHKEQHTDHKHKVEDKVTIDKHHHDATKHSHTTTGVDPTLNRDVATHVQHEGAVSREVVEQATHTKEKIREVELHKVQPVVHRDREQVEIRHVVQPHKVQEVAPTQIHTSERTIDAGVRHEASTLETSREAGHAPDIKSSTQHMGVTERQHTELPTRVEETVHKKVVEHVHPVIYKEVLVPKVKEEIHHIHETVKEHPVETYEVRDVIHHETRGDSKMSEREFFDKFSATGISGDSHQTHTHTHTTTTKLGKDGKPKMKDASKKHKEGKVKKTKTVDKTVVHTHEQPHTHVHTTTAPMATHAVAAEPMIGHSQNIGAHQLASAAVPTGHNVAYDAALAAPSKKEKEVIKESHKESKSHHAVV